VIVLVHCQQAIYNQYYVLIVFPDEQLLPKSIMVTQLSLSNDFVATWNVPGSPKIIVEYNITIQPPQLNGRSTTFTNDASVYFKIGNSTTYTFILAITFCNELILTQPFRIGKISFDDMNVLEIYLFPMYRELDFVVV